MLNRFYLNCWLRGVGVGLIALALLPGCTEGSTAQSVSADGAEHGHDHAQDAPPEDPSIVRIPASVRDNLGITFARAEVRHVTCSLRVPGRFELRPDATREYRAALPGRVELLVNQYDHVTTGTPLYRLDSAQWRQMQQEYVNAQAEVLSTSASLMAAQVAREGGAQAVGVIKSRIAAGEQHIETVSAAVKTAEERLKQVQRLHEIVGGRLNEVNEARAQLAALRNELSQAREHRAELEQQQLQLSTDSSGGAFGTTETLRASAVARRAEYEAAHARRDLVRASLEFIQPLNEAGDSTSSSTLWEPNALITVRATREGVVSNIGTTNGGFVESAGHVLTTVDGSRLRFRAVALQSDLGRLDRDMPAQILRPGDSHGGHSHGGDSEGAITAVAHLSLEADPERRTLDIIADVNTTATWPRAGVSTDMELVLDTTDEVHLAIPVGAVIQDGLEKVFFRRDPNNPDIARRVKADLGISDGSWVCVESGIREGDEVVLDGIYELKLATSDAQVKGGHFHADGTFHEGEH